MTSSLRSIHFNRLPDFCTVFVPSIWSSNKPFSLNTTFRFFCHKILRTTQISNACVLLALLYIRRLRSAYPAIQASIGSEVRLFTTALILANKFLDDNTFTNKTWSDVSGIPVGELNIMEIEFLSALDYTIYVHHTQFFAWVAQCQSYRRTSFSMSVPVRATTTNHAATDAAAAAMVTTTKSLKRSAAVMTAPYQRLPSKRRHHQKHHVPHTPPDETSYRQPPTIVTHNHHQTPHLPYCSPMKHVSPNFYSSASVMQLQQQQQPVLSWSSSSSAVASSRHTVTTSSTFVSSTAASVCSPSNAAAIPLVATFAPTATMIPSSLLTTRVRCLEIE